MINLSHMVQLCGDCMTYVFHDLLIEELIAMPMDSVNIAQCVARAKIPIQISRSHGRIP